VCVCVRACVCVQSRRRGNLKASLCKFQGDLTFRLETEDVIHLTLLVARAVTHSGAGVGWNSSSSLGKRSFPYVYSLDVII
jgi:hypothetical protein